jgi:hypothetical protein
MPGTRVATSDGCATGARARSQSENGAYAPPSVASDRSNRSLPSPSPPSSSPPSPLDALNARESEDENEVVVVVVARRRVARVVNAAIARVVIVRLMG